MVGKVLSGEGLGLPCKEGGDHSVQTSQGACVTRGPEADHEKCQQDEIRAREVLCVDHSTQVLLSYGCKEKMVSEF